MTTSPHHAPQPPCVGQSTSPVPIPALKISHCRTGGGWGLGDDFARLPPAEEQVRRQERVYRVAATQGDAFRSPSFSSVEQERSDEARDTDDEARAQRMPSHAGQRMTNGRAIPCPPPIAVTPASMAGRGTELGAVPPAALTVSVPEVQYSLQPEDDDNTFIDHGSVVHHRAASSVQSGKGVGSAVVNSPTSLATPTAQLAMCSKAPMYGIGGSRSYELDVPQQAGQSATSAYDEAAFAAATHFAGRTMSDQTGQTGSGVTHAAALAVSATPTRCAVNSFAVADTVVDAVMHPRAGSVETRATTNGGSIVSGGGAVVGGVGVSFAAQERAAQPAGAYADPAAGVAPSTATLVAAGGGGRLTTDRVRRTSGQLPAAPTAARALPNWLPTHPVSCMTMEQRMRDMAIGPDGATLWTAIGDDPVTMMELDGTELTVSKVLHTIRQVSCMAVVRTPGTAQRTFAAIAESAKTAATGKAKGAKGRKSGGRGAGGGASATHRHAHRSSGGVEATSLVVAEQGEDSYALWCGMPRGMITIVDLQRCTNDGCIANAHTDTIQRIWSLENGKVWTAGRDKALKVWDPQTRRKIKTRNIAAILSDLCYVRTTQQVWAIANDSIIRVYDAGGDNVCVAKRSPEMVENALKMRSEVTVIAYNTVTDLVWAGLSRGTMLIQPTSYDVVASVNLTITALTFYKNTAILTGQGALLGTSVDCVAVLDIASRALEPVPLFIGSAMPQVQPIGIRLFTSVPLAVVAQTERFDKRCTLAVFTYAETRPFGKLASAPTAARDAIVIAPQRQVVVGHRLHTANGGGTAPSTLAPPARMATGAILEPSNRPAATRITATPVQEDEPHREGDKRSPNRLSESRPTLVSTLRPAMPTVIEPASRAAGATPVTPAPTPAGDAPREILSSLGELRRSGDELRAMMLNWRRAEAPLADFARLQQTLTRFVLDFPDDLPALEPETSATIDREYNTQEGRSLAIAVARLMQLASRAAGGAAAHESRRASAVTQVAASDEAVDLSAGSGRSPRWALTRNAVGPAGRAPSHRSGAPPPQSSPLALQVTAGGGSNGGGSSALVEEDRGVGAAIVAAPQDRRASPSPQQLLVLPRDPCQAVVAGAPSDTTSLLTCMLQLSQRRQGEQAEYQKQLRSLQRHNERSVERNAALVRGLARVQQAVYTHLQSRLAGSPRPSPVQLTAWQAALGSLRQARPTSSPSTIDGAVDSLLEALSVSWAAATPRSPSTTKQRLLLLPPSSPAPTGSLVRGDGASRREVQSPSSPRLVEAAGAVNGDGAANARQHHAAAARTMAAAANKGHRVDAMYDPTALLACPARRLLSMLQDATHTLVAFGTHFGRAWGRIEDMQRIIMDDAMTRREGGRHGKASGLSGTASDLLPPPIVLWDLMLAQAMQDLCRQECCLVIVETLLEARHDGFFANITTDATGPKEERPDASPSLALFVAEEERTALRGAVAAATAPLVEVSIEIENSGTRVRRSLREMKARAAARNGGNVEESRVPRSSTTPRSFLAAHKSLAIEQRRLQGLLYWADLTTHRIADCLRYAEQLTLRPVPVSTADDKTAMAAAAASHRSRLLVLTQKLDNWLRVLRGMGDEMNHVALVLQSARDRQGGASQSESPALRFRPGDASTSQSPWHAAEVGNSQGLSFDANNLAESVDGAWPRRLGALQPHNGSKGSGVGVGGDGDDGPGAVMLLPTLLAFYLLYVFVTRAVPQSPLLLQSLEGAVEESGEVADELEGYWQSAVTVCRRTRRLVRRAEALRGRVCGAVQDNRSPSLSAARDNEGGADAGVHLMATMAGQ